MVAIMYSRLRSAADVGVSLLDDDVWFEVTVELALCVVEVMSVVDCREVVCSVEVAFVLCVEAVSVGLSVPIGCAV